QAIVDALGQEDGVGCFAAVYLRTTVAVRERLGTGFFADDDFVEKLDVVFAGHFFAAVDADASAAPVDHAWRALFESRADRRVQAIQDVLAGMNAHINHDLALSVVGVCTVGGTEPSEGTIHQDYLKINQVLAAIEADVRRELVADLQLEFPGAVEPLLHLLSSWSIDAARDAAWVKAQALWALRQIPVLFDQVVAISSRSTGLVTRQLLTPLLY
ncbi:MAG: DUF5995 family protein, partial [Nakamurella sp.]